MRSRWQSWLAGFLVCLGLFALAGCAKPADSSGSGAGSGGGGTTSAKDLTGNWQFQVTSSGNVPFSGLSGFLSESTGSSSNLTTASLQVQSSSCFSNTKVLDLQGYTSDPYAQLVAFPSYSQTVTLNLSETCTGGVSLCGNYQVTGGCADGLSGQIVGVVYTTLKGTFRSPSNVSPAVAATLTQSALGTGQGSFAVSGTLAFTGASCLTTGTVDATQSYLSGSALHLVATTDAMGAAVLTVDATINAAATSITLNTISLAGNSSCLSSLNGASLS